jgi:hypothetical protein
MRSATTRSKNSMTTNDVPSSPTAPQTEASDPKAGRCAVATGYAFSEMEPAAFDEILKRARDPQEGDVYEKGCAKCTVTSHADGIVHARIDDKLRGEPTDMHEPIENWWHLAEQTLKHGARFFPHNSRGVPMPTENQKSQ